MNNFKKLRLEHKLTQQNIADLLNCSQNAIYQYEANKNEPDMNTLIKLADFYGVSIDYLVGRANDDEIVTIINQLSKDEEYLLNILRKLPALDKEIVYKFAELTLNQFESKKNKNAK